MSKYGPEITPYLDTFNEVKLNLNRGIPEMRKLIDNIANKIFKLVNTAIVSGYSLLMFSLRATPFKPDKSSNANLEQVQLE